MFIIITNVWQFAHSNKIY